MTNREKVIKALSDELVDKRNQRYASARISFEFIETLIELLKEQEHKDRMFHALEDDWKRLKELLKEQDERYVRMVVSWLREIAINNVDSNREMTFLDAVEDIRDRASYGLKQYFVDKQEGR